jgi:hypothetical protein
VSRTVCRVIVLLNWLRRELSNMSSPNSRYSLLQHRADAFCQTFMNLKDNPVEQILNEHFTRNGPKITEHGPSWANKRLPFLGRTFEGRDQCIEYFKLLSDVLEFIPHKDSFPQREKFVVDDKAYGDGSDRQNRGQVSVAGRGTFKAIKTGQQWNEYFIYRLSGFDEYGKIGHWEIWADPLSAWMAAGGDLNNV